MMKRQARKLMYIVTVCAKLSGEPSLSRVELFTQNAYFAFQVVQVFLVATISSAIPSVAQGIAEDPTSITSVLAQNIPTASNFYINYFIVQGLTIAAGVISQVVGFVIFTLLYKYLAGTPRAMYQKWANLSALSWGSLLPVYTNIAVISRCPRLPFSFIHLKWLLTDSRSCVRTNRSFGAWFRNHWTWSILASVALQYPVRHRHQG